MTARQTEASLRAVAWATSAGRSAAEAAKKHGVSVRTVQRGLAASNKARPVGRPAPATDASAINAQLLEALTVLCESDAKDRASGVARYARGSDMDKKWKAGRAAIAAASWRAWQARAALAIPPADPAAPMPGA